MLLHEQVFIIHRQSVEELLARFLNGSLSPIIIDFPSFKKANLEAVTASKSFCADLSKPRKQTFDLVKAPTIAVPV